MPGSLFTCVANAMHMTIRRTHRTACEARASERSARRRTSDGGRGAGARVTRRCPHTTLIRERPTAQCRFVFEKNIEHPACAQRRVTRTSDNNLAGDPRSVHMHHAHHTSVSVGPIRCNAYSYTTTKPPQRAHKHLLLRPSRLRRASLELSLHHILVVQLLDIFIAILGELAREAAGARMVGDLGDAVELTRACR